MKRLSLIVAAMMFTSVLFIGMTFLPGAKATTRYVGGAGPGNYSTIQAAIDDANPGDMVFVHKGTYSENLVVNTSLSMIGEDRDKTTLDGRGKGDVVYIVTNHVNVTGFTIVNSDPGNGSAGVNVYFTRNCSVVDNNISGNNFGIVLLGSGDNVISNNTLSGNSRDGILVGLSHNNTIAGNNVSHNGRNGIFIASSMHNVLAHNTAMKNEWEGLSIQDSESNTLDNNSVSSNRESGIDIESSKAIFLASNTLTEDGIRIHGQFLEHWNTHGIDPSNTVNGKPVYYWKNISGGAVPTNAGQVILANCTDVRVESQNMSTGDVGIALGMSSQNAITGNNVSGHDEGIFLYQSGRNTINNNVLSQNSNGLRVRNSYLNEIGSNTLSGNGWGVYVIDGFRNSVSYNVVLDSEYVGIGLSYSYSDIVHNNSISYSSDGIYLSNSEGILIADNTLVENGIVVKGDLVDEWNSHTIATSNNVNSRQVHYWKDVSGGTIPSGAGQVILANTTSVIVDAQNISKASEGIQVGFSHNVTISNSTLSGNQDGIALHYSDNTKIVGGRMTGNFVGVGLWFSRNNTIAGNMVSRSEWDGIILAMSDGNIIRDNEISKNLGGVLMFLSSNNSVYHNNFMYNTGQAGEWRGVNQWDNGYPSGGNFWSDYVGTDDWSGPNQDLPGSDGIGDVPYTTIGADSQDRYPLIYPYGTAHPWPPTLIGANLTGMNLENVTLPWYLSPDDDGGLASVVAYDIFRGIVYYQDARDYQLIGSVPNQTTVFTDPVTGEGDTNDYFYRICSVDNESNSTCSVKQAAKFTRPLAQGPNLVSVPLVQSNESIERVLQTLSFDKAWYYDSLSQEWKWYMKSKTYRRGLWGANHTMGLWVNVTQPSNLTVAGMVPAQTMIELRTGWNIVSFPSFNVSYTVGDLKVRTGATRVERYDLVPPYFLRVLGDAEVLLAGMGYWVRVDADVDWIVEAS